MNDEDKKLLEAYLREIKKKRIIVFISIISFILFCTIITGKYYIKNIPINENSNNNINVQKNDNKPLNEIVENNTTNSEIISENVIENHIQNSENAVVEQPQEQSSKDDKKQEEKEPQPSKTTASENKKNETTKNKPSNKDFLFTDGYTMDNVSQVAQEYLKSSGYAGECVPLKDSEGIYYGMRVIFH